MVTSNSRLSLPNSDELPSSDDTPVDNEEQNLLPNFLLFLLYAIWAERTDWFFAVDMAVYHTTGISPKVPVVPDGFLSLSVARRKNGKPRKSYVVWEENDTVPILALEIVSHTPGGEYEEKLEIYTKLGVLYCVIYNPRFWQRDRHLPFEVYKLIEGKYQLQIGEPYWMPEVGLGIGRHQTNLGSMPQEVLTWYNQQGDRYLTAEEREQQERQRADRLAAQLRAAGIEPEV